MRIDAFFDGEINPEDRAHVLRHLDECKRCLAIFDGEKELRSAMKGKTSQVAPARLRDKVLHCINHEEAEEAELEARDTNAPFQPCHHDVSRSGFELRFDAIRNHPTRGPINCWIVTHKGDTAPATFPKGLIESINGRTPENGLKVLTLKDRTTVLCLQCGRGKCLYLVGSPEMAKELIVTLKD